MLKPSKCHFFQRQIDFLGHRISGSGVATCPTKISAVADWAPCQNVKQVRQFLGLTGYYRKFIANYSSIAAPLTNLLQTDTKFVWDEVAQGAMNKLKEALITSPVLAYPQQDEQYILDTDASDYGIGAVLSQVQDGVKKVIAYASRKLSRREQNYAAYRKEMLALVYYVKYFRHYLLGVRFIVRTDKHIKFGMQFLRQVKKIIFSQ